MFCSGKAREGISEIWGNKMWNCPSRSGGVNLFENCGIAKQCWSPTYVVTNLKWDPWQDWVFLSFHIQQLRGKSGVWSIKFEADLVFCNSSETKKGKQEHEECILGSWGYMQESESNDGPENARVVGSEGRWVGCLGGMKGLLEGWY